jgi:hypothetical protein
LNLNAAEAQQLQSRMKKIMKGQFRLARSLRDMRYGKVDEKILDGTYRRRSMRFMRDLAPEISKLGLTEKEIDHVHTRNCRYSSMLTSNYLSGRNGIPEILLRFFELADASKWSGEGKNDILDPKLQLDLETTGLYIGHFLFGHGFVSRKLSYRSKQNIRNFLLDLLERVGTLERDISISSTSSKQIAEGFHKNTTSDNVSKKYVIPSSFLCIANYALEHEYPGVYKAALYAWLVDRFSDRKEQQGGYARMKPEYEETIRHMAQAIGLSISEGYVWGNKRIVYVRNPEIVGYRPDNRG